jgi:WD40 repeat protein
VLRQTRPILSLALHPDGVLAACGDDEGCVRIVHVGQGKMLASRHIGRGRIDDLSFSNDGKWLAVAASDDLHICNAADLGLTKTSEGRGHQPMASTAFSPNSRVLARAGREGLIYIGDVLKTGAEPPIHTVGPNIRTCTFDPDGRHLLCGGDSRVIEVWDISTRQRVGQYYGHKERVAGLSVSPNGSLLASASFDGTVRLWSMEKPTNSKLLLAAPGADHVEFAARGSLLLVGSSGDLRSFETHRWQQKARVPADCFEVATGAVGGFVVTWYQSKGTVRQIDTLKEVWSFNPEAFRPQSLAGLLLSADGRQVTLKVQPLMNVAGVGSQGRLYRYDAPNSNVTAEVYRASGAFVSFAVSPRTSHIVLSNSDSTDLIDIPGTGKNESRIRSSAGLIRQLSFNSDGSLFAAASEDRSVYVWQADTYKLRAALIGHEASVNCVAFAPDGMTLASGDDSGIVRFWDLQTKHEILRLQAHSLPVKSVAFSSDGRLLATATARLPDKSGEVKIWFAGPPTISSGGSSATVSAVK